VLDPDGDTVVYAVTGQLFFASSNDLADRFDYVGDPDRVVIDLSQAHVWDASSVATLDTIAAKYAARDKEVELIGLNGHSADLHDRLSGHLSSSH
jgi:SulP family sulfate permease